MKKRKMGFKRNITITVACVITECLISLLSVILMIYLFFMIDKLDELFSTLLIVPYLILLINVFLIIISLIGRLFIKTNYYINNNCLVVKTNSSFREIQYKEIHRITYDLGDLTRFNTQPSQLILFDHDFKQLLSINNPSILMTIMIKKKCKKIKIDYYHRKRLMFLFLIINGTALFALLLFKLIS